ncbi:MAG: alpha/beta fold hydrolase [Candidatus Carbobacillus altaicus]|nr:alpha/beta fold hydrolase [Candidatus Carbobacillus altaicus]
MSEHVSIWYEWLGVPIKQYYVVVNGIRTRVVEAGDGEALILVHGTGGHVEAYARNLRELSKHFRVITYDMVGHGLSEKPDLPYTIDVLSDHLVGLAKALQLERFHVSGESLGGWVAAWTAAHHPDMVGKLFLNTPGNITNKPEVMQRVKESTIKAVVEANRENVRSRLEWLFYDKSFVTEELVDIRLNIYRQPEMKKAVYHIVSVQEWDIRKRYAWDPAWVGNIKAPTLIIWTDHDPTGTVEEAELLHSWIPGSEFLLIQDAGHWPQWEKPEAFNKAHIDFIQKGSSIR